MKYIALLLCVSVIFTSGIANWRWSLGDPSQLKTDAIERISTAVVMHVVSWFVGDKLLSRVIPFPQNKTINVVIAVVGLSVGEIIRRRISNIEIKQDRCFKKTSAELKIAAAYGFTTVSYAAAAVSIPMKNSFIEHYNKYNLFTLVTGYALVNGYALLKIVKNFK